MNLDEIKQAIGNPGGSPHQPEGDSVVTPLTGYHLAKPEAEAAPADVSAMQGAGAPGNSLAPAPGEPANGALSKNFISSAGPELLPAIPGLGALTAGGNFGANRPSGGTAPAAEPVGRDDTALGRDQSQGVVINPALRAALTPRLDGPFGKPS